MTPDIPLPCYNAADCRTVVELPDRRRVRRSGVWGEPGDTVLVKASGATWYTPEPTP